MSEPDRIAAIRARHELRQPVGGCQLSMTDWPTQDEDIHELLDRLAVVERELTELRAAISATPMEQHALVALAEAHRADSEKVDALEVKLAVVECELDAMREERAAWIQRFNRFGEKEGIVDSLRIKKEQAESALLTLQRHVRRAESCLREWVAQDGWTNASVAYQSALSIEIAQDLALLLPSLAEKE